MPVNLFSRRRCQSTRSFFCLALQRNADTSKSKREYSDACCCRLSYLVDVLAHLCEDANKILVATRSCFVHTSIDYTHQINGLFDQQKVDLIELLFSYLNSHKAFFHQGYELLAIDTERDWNSINSQVRMNENEFPNFSVLWRWPEWDKRMDRNREFTRPSNEG